VERYVAYGMYVDVQATSMLGKQATFPTLHKEERASKESQLARSRAYRVVRFEFALVRTSHMILLSLPTFHVVSTYLVLLGVMLWFKQKPTEILY